MYAIVLTHDERAPFVELLLRQYDALWPNCPLVFRIPYNNNLPHIKTNLNIQYIKSEKSILSTIQILLNGISNDKMVYWCIDDLYPVKIMHPNILTKVVEFAEQSPQNIGAIRVIVSEMDTQFLSQRFMIDNFQFKLRNPFMFRWFWLHHFVRVKYIKALFFKSGIQHIWQVERFAKKMEKALPSFIHPIYMPPENLMLLGETTRSNNGTGAKLILSNCAHDMNKMGITIPDNYNIMDLSVYNDHRYPGHYII